MRLHIADYRLSIKTFLLFILVFIGSCATDDVSEKIPEDTPSEGTDPQEEEQPTEESEVPDTGSIVFEEGFLLTEDRLMTNLVLTTAEYNKFIQGEGDIRMISEKVYEFLEDDFDFIIILSVEAVQPPDLFFGRTTPVQNLIEGLGSNTYDNSGSYGSDGRLKSIIYMPRVEYIRNGPFLHEIVHLWGNKGFISTTVGGHWGYASVAGQLGGFDELVSLGGNSYRGSLNGSNGFGTFANGGNSIPYGNLELYLMGLIGPDELEAIQVAQNPEAGISFGEFTAEAIETLSAEELIERNGTRLPSYEDAQKSFKALTVVISKEELSQDNIAAVQSDLENFSRPAAPDSSWGNTNNFWMATQGKATFEFEIAAENIR